MRITVTGRIESYKVKWSRCRKSSTRPTVYARRKFLYVIPYWSAIWKGLPQLRHDISQMLPKDYYRHLDRAVINYEEYRLAWDLKLGIGTKGKP